MSLPDDYRDYFIRNLHDALSGHRSSSVAEVIVQMKEKFSLFFLFQKNLISLKKSVPFFNTIFFKKCVIFYFF